MKSSTKKRKRKEYLKVEGLRNVYVIPYLRGRLAFAQLAARAIEKEGFESLLVDLPYFMNKDEFWRTPVQLFPHVSYLIISREDERFVKLPFSPSDAPCMALASASIQREWGVEMEVLCVDDSQIINYPEDALARRDFTAPDDYLITLEGLEAYLSKLSACFASAYESFTESEKTLLACRARIVRERLKQAAQKGKKTLFICEYSLWWMIERIGKGREAPSSAWFSAPWKTLKAAFLLEQPRRAWARKLLDDYPAVVNGFYKRATNGTLQDFDKGREMEKVMNTALSRGSARKTGQVSIRKSLTFTDFLQRITIGSRRLLPHLQDHIHEAAMACMGRKQARHLVAQLLAYPRLRMPAVQEYVHIDEDGVTSGALPFALPDWMTDELGYVATYGPNQTVMEETQTRQDFLRDLFPTLTRAERSSMTNKSFQRWAAQEDYRLHEIACRKLRDIVLRKEFRQKVVRCTGSPGEGIHWKRTINSKAAGEDALYIRKKSKRPRPQYRFDELTPVVFIFSDGKENCSSSTIHDSNITQRYTELGLSDLITDSHPMPDYVYSVYYTSTEWKMRCEGHLHKEKLSSLALLCNQHIMGTVRYEKITKREERFQCRVTPGSDRDLRSFTAEERGLAWAVKYARDVVLVAAYEGWKPSTAIVDFATERGVKIIEMSLSVFHPDFVERLQTIHFTSTALKRNPDRDRIVRRFMS